MRFKAFVSSTFQDLQAHRAHVIATLRRSGFDVDPMEDWTASSDAPKHFSQTRMEGCDLCVLLVARRRGFIPDGEVKSITQLEYEAALERDISVLPYLLDDAAPWPSESDESATDVTLRAWREEIGRNHGRELFSERPESLQIAPALTRWVLQRTPRGSVANLTPAPLPEPSSPFIGRARELRELREKLCAPDAHLVTLLGGPGLGKSRLGIETARQLASEFMGGSCWVDLSEKQTLAGLATAVAECFRIPLTGATPPEVTVAKMLASRPPMLVVLDNFEQLVEYAEATVALWVREAPHIRFLVTSRTVLDVDEEVCHWLEAMPDPLAGGTASNAPSVSENDAVQLFISRARRKRGNLTLTEEDTANIAKICHELECHPLCIVLAAERANAFTSAQMLARLSKILAFLDGHAATLRATIQWSYDLLTPAEQEVFQQACIFKDGFDLEAAEAVIALSPAQAAAGDVASAVAQLCDQSLLLCQQHSGVTPRYWMFKAIEEYGRGLWGGTHSDERPPEELRARHAAYFRGWSEREAVRIRTPECREALDRFVVERANLVAVHKRALAAGDAPTAAQIILAYSRVFQARGPTALRAPKLEETLAAVTTPELRVRLLIELSDALWSTNDWPRAAALADDAVAFARPLGDDLLRASAFLQQGRMRNAMSDRQRAIDAFTEARALYQGCDPLGEASTLAGLGHVHDRLGLHAQAVQFLAESERILRRLQDPMPLARTLNFGGLALWHVGRPADAVPQFAEAEGINRSLGDLMWVSGNLTNRGFALTDLDRCDEALPCFEEAGQMQTEFGNQAWAGINLGGRGCALLETGRLDAALEALAAAEKIATAVGSAEDIALHAGNRGRTLARLGRLEEARTAFRSAVETQRKIGGDQDPRFFGNLARLAAVEDALAHPDEALALAREAEEIARVLQLSTAHPVRRIREDLALLPPLLARGQASATTTGVHGVAISTDQFARISGLVTGLSFAPRFEFPWDGLEAYLAARKETHLQLVGYGSLISAASAKRTIAGEDGARRPPVLGFGIRRLFNYEMPPGLLQRYGTALDCPARAALNVHVTHDPDDVLNGVLVEVRTADFDALRAREPGYDLVPIACVWWDEVARAPFPAFILAAPETASTGQHWTRSDLQPHRAYLDLCDAAAAEVSPLFHAFFRATTFLADGQTPAIQPGT